MSELFQLILGLAIMSWRYNTFRGRWTDMPDSTGLRPSGWEDVNE